jgi:O-antigen/teichoic acid export membrane protein
MLKRLAYLPGYLAVTILTATARFFVVNLLIRNLGTGEFGRWSLFEPVVVVLSQAVLMGVNFGVIKQINQDKMSPIASVQYLLVALQPSMIAMSAVVFLVSLRLGLAWPGPLFLALYIYTESVFLLLFSVYRAAGTIAGFAASSILKVLVLLLVLGVALNHPWPTVRRAEDVIFWSFWSSLSALVFGFLVVRLLHYRLFFAPSGRRESHWRVYVDAVRYGLPLLATGLLAMLVEFGSRYLLKIYIDYSRLANYVIYLKICSMLEVLIIAPFGLWWPTERFRELESKDGGRRFFRMMSVGMLAVLLAAAGTLWFISDWVVSWLAPGVPANRFIVLLLTCAVVARGMAYPLNVGALKEGKTHWNIYAVLAAAMINTSLCLLLIPRYGVAGAAYATMVSYICYTAFLTLTSQRIHPVPLPYPRMLILVIIAALLLVALHRYLPSLSGLSKAVVFAFLSLTLYTPIVLPLVRARGAR